MNYCRDFRETGPRRGTKKIEITKEKEIEIQWDCLLITRGAKQRICGDRVTSYRPPKIR